MIFKINFWRFLILLLASTSNAIIKDIDPLIFISLGNNCVPALMLRFAGLREEAFPFDWLTTPMDGLCKVFRDDFKDYFLRENLTLYSLDNRVVLDTLYGFGHNHAFPTKGSVMHSDEEMYEGGEIVKNFLDFYQEVYSKYIRRIDRFKKILSGRRNIIFIRYRCNKLEAQKLAQMIKFCYPHLLFTLIAIDSTEEIKHDWKIPQVKNFYIKPNESSNIFSEETVKEWKEVLRSII